MPWPLILRLVYPYASDRGDITDGTLNGLIDDVRIYNRALSLDEIIRRHKIGGTFKVNSTISNDSLKTGLVGQIVYTGLSES